LNKSDAGRKTLQRIGYSGFYAVDAATLAKLDKWFAQ
jgi:hypothetical protein